MEDGIFLTVDMHFPAGGTEVGSKGTISVKHPGQIVLFRFPHTSLAEGKTPPALLLQKCPTTLMIGCYV